MLPKGLLYMGSMSNRAEKQVKSKWKSENAYITIIRMEMIHGCI